MWIAYRFRAATVLLCLLAPMALALADGAADFYSGRNVDLYIGYSVGGAQSS